FDVNPDRLAPGGEVHLPLAVLAHADGAVAARSRAGRIIDACSLSRAMRCRPKSLVTVTRESATTPDAPTERRAFRASPRAPRRDRCGLRRAGPRCSTARRANRTARRRRGGRARHTTDRPPPRAG